MTHERFYRVGSAIPLLLPLAVALVAWVFFLRGETVNLDNLPWPLEIVAGVSVWLWFSLWYMGLPYAVFAALSLWALKGRSPRAYFRFTLLAPLLLAGLLCAAATIYYFVDDVVKGADFRGVLGLCGFLGGLTLLSGYFYVGVIHIVRKAFTSIPASQ